MKLTVRPIVDYKLCPSNMTLDSSRVYSAIHATNQPEWEKHGLRALQTGFSGNSGLRAQNTQAAR